MTQQHNRRHDIDNVVFSLHSSSLTAHAKTATPRHKRYWRDCRNLPSSPSYRTAFRRSCCTGSPSPDDVANSPPNCPATISPCEISRLPAGSNAAIFSFKQRIMRTGQQYRVDIRRFCSCKLIHVFFDKIIGPGLIMLIVLDQRHPQRASLLINAELGIKFCDLDRIGFRQDRSPGRQYPYVAGPGIVAYHLRRRPDHPQDPVIRRYPGQIHLLDGPKRLGRSGITRQDHQRAPC